MRALILLAGVLLLLVLGAMFLIRPRKGALLESDAPATTARESAPLSGEPDPPVSRTRADAAGVEARSGRDASVPADRIRGIVLDDSTAAPLDRF